MPHTITGPGSITRRPDAISVDYTMSHAFGPRALGDNTAGMLNRVWRVRTDGLSLWLARAQDGHVGYDPEVLMVQLPADAVPIRELDVAFDQNGRVVICTERLTGPLDTPEIWLYWFDPVQFQYVYEPLCFGRNPRVILDEPIPYSSTSDVLIWFFSNTNQKLAYRRQRDRYQGEYYIESIEAENRFVEDAYRSIDNRLHVLFSERNIPSGTYILDHVESTLYPFWPPAEILEPRLELDPSSALGLGLLEASAREELTMALLMNTDLGGGTLVEGLLVYDSSAEGRNQPESLYAAAELFLGSLVEALIDVDLTALYYERMQSNVDVVGGSLVRALFDITTEADSMTTALEITGGTLGP